MTPRSRFRKSPATIRPTGLASFANKWFFKMFDFRQSKTAESRRGAISANIAPLL